MEKDQFCLLFDHLQLGLCPVSDVKAFYFPFNSRPEILLFIVTVIFYPLNNIIENENFNIEFLFKGFFKVEYFHEHFNSHVYCWNFLVFNKYLWFNKNLSKCKVLS